MSTSGTYAFDPSLSDIGIDAFERIQIRAAEITPDHMLSLRRSMNYVLARWSNLQVNLWTVVLETISLPEGVAQYSVPANTVTMLDTYLRTYQLGSPVDLVPDFETTISTTTVTVNQTNHGLSVGFWININVPVSIGGIVLQGFYQVQSVTSLNSYTITAADTATSTATGGVVPEFATTGASIVVTVTLPNHGLLAGQSFTVQVETLVGGLVLIGVYTVASVTDANTFTFENSYAAGSSETAFENDGETQIAGQSSATGYVDRIVTSMSRTDYASLANKTTPAPPTSYWFDRTVPPTVTLWPVPDDNGPYELRYYRVRQVQDATPKGGQTAEIPYRFQEAFAAGVAAHLAIKWRPENAEKLLSYATAVFEEAASEDRERVTLNLSPSLDTYYN